MQDMNPRQTAKECKIFTPVRRLALAPQRAARAINQRAAEDAGYEPASNGKGV